MLTDLQERKLTHFFGLLDLDKDGSLQIEDFSEIAERLQQEFGYAEGSKEHKFVVDAAVRFFHKLLAEMSKGNQVILMSEWLEFFDAQFISNDNDDLLEEYSEFMIGFLFDLFDENHDGYIDVEEYADMFMIYGIDIRYSAKAFIDLDLNKDGRLSRNELIHAFENFITSDIADVKGNWIFGNWDT
ncbi:MAG: EF-hand domain-containing protein [Cyclobacteriaceae bacterium]|nr:EF-hand domain-containing protein [Cyclobacteriaceae bacterium HetDA_MAG_MS6]